MKHDQPTRDFDTLVTEVKSCARCERMQESCRVLGRASGELHAPLMFIGEAPGRLGADDTAIPFHGDRAGENFERLIEQVGISRYDSFITNAVLCNPKDENGNNATPTRKEIANCAGFLKRQLDLVKPRLVVTLGNQALQAIKLIESHDIDLASGVRKKWTWYDRLLLPLYHPGQRAMLHRSFLNQLADYRFVAEQLKRTRVKRTSSVAGQTNADVAHIVTLLLMASGPISYFRLHKLFYLLEYHHARERSCRLTASYVVRQKDGPYFTDLHIAKLRKAIPALEVSNKRGRLILSVPPRRDLFDGNDAGEESGLAEFVGSIVEKYHNKNDRELKTAVYFTQPMRSLLRREKYDGANLFNAPINFYANLS